MYEEISKLKVQIEDLRRRVHDLEVLVNELLNKVNAVVDENHKLKKKLELQEKMVEVWL